MDQSGKQVALSRSLENRITGMEKLLERLTAQLNMPITEEIRFFRTFNTPAKPATIITPSKNK